MRDADVEMREPRIVGLPTREAAEDLLDDDGNLEEREGLVELNVRQVAAASCRVPIDDLVAREPAGPIRDGRQRVAMLGRLASRPVREQDADVNERVTERAHLPVEYGDEPGEIAGIEHDVVELEVAVDDRRVLRIGRHLTKQPS